MSRLLAVAEEGLVVDPRLQALEVEPARGLVATIVIAIERHLVEARVVIGIPSRGRSICNKLEANFA